MKISIQVLEIAAHFNLEIKGRSDLLITNIAAIDFIQPGSLCFAENKLKSLPNFTDYCVVTTSEIAVQHSNALITEKPKLLFASILDYLIEKFPDLKLYDRLISKDYIWEQPWIESGENVIHSSACISADIHLGKGIEIGPNVVIDKGVSIGDNSRIIANSFVGANCRIGDNCVVYPNVTIYSCSEIGNKVIIHAGCVIGSDGFGYIESPSGVRKFEQIGKVIIEDDVEMGANCSVDRGALGNTIIGRGCKFDNQVHVAHNVIIGEGCMFAAQTGIAGSAKIGKYCVTGGQAGVVGFVDVGDYTQVAGQAGITKSFKAGSIVSGFPARDHKEMLKIQAAEMRLPQLLIELKELKNKIKKLEDLIIE